MGEYVPSGHNKHTEGDLDVVGLSEYVPAGHAMQLDAWLLMTKNDAGQEQLVQVPKVLLILIHTLEVEQFPLAPP